MDVAPWDIVRVDFPLADEARARRRPALDARLVQRIGVLAEGDRARVAACVRGALEVVLLG